MASLIAKTTGNFTASSSWGTVDSTSELDSEANTTAVSTSNLDSATFTPGAITVDGVALKHASRASSPSGTFTVTLRNSTDSINVASVTVNVSDLPNVSSIPHWVFYRFSSDQTLTAGKAYLIRVVCSATGSQVTLYRNATSNNHSRKLRTTTEAAPASGDHLVVCGERTGTGTSNAFTITMNNTATTSFGPTVSGGPPQGVVVSDLGTWTNGTAASTNYHFRWKGIWLVSANGVVNNGTSGTPIPSTSTLTLYADSASNVDSGIQNQGGTYNCYGASKLSATVLTADRSASDTVITVSATTNWANGDVLAFAPTGSNITDGEKKTISTVDSSTQVTLSTGLTNPHSGSNPRRAEVINLTRNVKYTGASSTLAGFFSTNSTGTTVIKWAEFTNWGNNTTNKRGVDIQTTTGSCVIEGCAFYDIGNNRGQIYISGTASNNFTIQDNVFFNVINSNINISQATSESNWSVTGNVSISAGTDAGAPFDFSDCAGSIKGNNVSGKQASVPGIYFRDSSMDFGTAGNYDDNVAHNNQWAGIQVGGAITNSIRGTASNWRCYFNTESGVLIAASGSLTLVSGNFFGNTNNSTNKGNIQFSGISLVLTLQSCTLASTSVRTSSHGLLHRDSAAESTSGAGGYLRAYIFDSNFGVVSGINQNHSTADVAILSSQMPEGILQVTAQNSSFASSTVISGISGMSHRESFFGISRFGGTTNSHRRYVRDGLTQIDTAIVNLSSQSQRLIPSSSSNKLRSTAYAKTVNDGATATFSVYVRKSSTGSGDSATYAGNEPRLIVRQNSAAGISSDTVLATMTAAAGSWQQLTGITAAVTDNAVLEAFVDCDGTAGFVNVADWS